MCQRLADGLNHRAVADFFENQCGHASGRTDDDVATAWLAEACDTMRTWDDFPESGDDFMTLDVKLATALLAFFKDDKAHVIETSQIMFSLIDEQM